MHVVPIVVDLNMLCPHVLLVRFHGGGKGLFRAGVVAGAIEDVAGHVDHVSRGWRETAEDFGAVKSLLRVRTPLNGMNPVMIRRRVVRILLEDGLENRQGFLFAGARLTI